MAEQAVNTIYLLGEQPDKFCGQIIRNLTARVFSKASEGDAQRDTADEEMAVDSVVDDDGPATPSKAPKAQAQPPTSDDTQRSFPLAQLVFVVGHVAIKHIVYLELVEREFKRRKDEKAKGVYCLTAHCKSAANIRNRSGEDSRQGRE
jgi:condensin complex subunit 1